MTRSILTIGNFDGVHRAHVQLIAQAKELAAGSDTPVVVLTFDPHPLSVVAPAKAPKRLMTTERRVEYLEKAGAGMVVVAESDPELLGLEAEDFIANVVVRMFHPAHIVEGPSFGFGRGRKGDPELLRTMAHRFGFNVEIVAPVTTEIDGETLTVSSSLIRRLLTAGKVDQAAACLGRPYELLGSVVEGERRGRTIGFPTANVAINDQLVPGDGVYCGWARVGDIVRQTAISVGRKETFGSRERTVEAHLLGFDGDLYGQSISLTFDRHLRDQRRFDSAEALIEQLKRDVDSTRRACDHQNAPTP